jgi:hypothetical protein
VSNGGTLIVFDPGTGDPLAVLNEVFGVKTFTFQLTSGGGAASPISLDAAGAAGTPFEGGPATLSINANATDTVLPSSLPDGSRVIYRDANGNSAVTLIPVGGGNVVIMGWDWFDAKPGGSQDGGWLAVLDTAASIVATSPIPTLSEWAMMAMAGLLLALGVFTLRRPRPAGA